MRRTVNKKSPPTAIGAPLATSTPKVAGNELTKRRVGNGVNGVEKKEEKRGGSKQVEEKGAAPRSAPSLASRMINLVFLTALLLLILVFTAIVIFERQESASFVESQPWLTDVRRAYYEPIKEVAMQKYRAAFAR